MVRWTGGTARQPGSAGTAGTACAVGCSTAAGRGRLHGHLIGIGSASPSARQRKLLGMTQISLTIGVFEIEQIVQRPVQMKGQVRDLLVQAVGPVRHDSPRRLPAKSTANSLLQFGQATLAWVWPSRLMRR